MASSDTSSFLGGKVPSLEAERLVAPLQPASAVTTLLVGVSKRGRLSSADQRAMTHAEKVVAKLPDVRLVRDGGVSRDGRARVALVAVGAGAFSPAGGDIVWSIRDSFAGQRLPSGLSIHVTGRLAANVDNRQATSKSQRRALLLANVAIIVVLLLVFRAPLAALVTLLPAVLVLYLAGPVIARASEAGFHVSTVMQIILTVLVLGAGTDYGLFLIFRVREELRRGLAPDAAVVRAVERVGESITFSAATVIGALLCLLLAGFGLYQGLGPGLAIAIALMLLAALTLLPALLAILGRAVFWPVNVRPGSQRIGAWGRIAARIVRRPVPTLLIGIVLLGGLAVAARGYAPTGLSGSSSGPSGSDSAAGSAALAAHFPASVANPTNVVYRFRRSVWHHLSEVQRAQRQLKSARVFRSVSGLLNPNGTPIQPGQLAKVYKRLGPPSSLPATAPARIHIPTGLYRSYRSLAQFVSRDGRTVQFYVAFSAGDPSSAAAIKAVPAARAVVSRVAHSVGAVQSGMAGQAAQAYDVSHASDTDLVHILPVVLALMVVLLAVVMRSLVAPLYLVASIALSYLAALGLAVLVFTHMGGGGLNFILPFLMFVFLMALGEDYNILVMSRIREEAHQRSLAEAVTSALNATGTTVTSAGLILASTFAVAGIVGTSDQIRQLGIGIAAGILIDTFLVRTLLVPSTVALLGRWNWWPSRLAYVKEPAPELSAAAATGSASEARSSTGGSA